jgi:hypothetical protein
MKQQIKTIYGGLIFEGDFETFREAVEAAVRRGISLKNADLSNANLSHTNLVCVDFSHADLSNAKLWNANLVGANLVGAKLSHAEPWGANLSNANLEDADLSHVDISHADLSDANLVGAKGIYLFNKPMGRTCYAVAHEKCFMIKAGCFWGTLDRFEAKCKIQYPDNSVEAYASQIEYLKKLSNI